MNPPSLAQRCAFLCLLGLAALMPLVPVSHEMPMTKHLLFAVLASCGALFLWASALRRSPAPALGTPTDLAYAAFLASALPSVVLAQNPGMAQVELGNLTCLGLTYLLAVKTLRTRWHVLVLYGVVLLGGLIISALGLIAYRDYLASGASEFARSGHLSTDLFPHSYLAAQYLVMVFVGGMVIVIERGLPTVWRVTVGVCLAPIAAYLLAIGSRGAYLAVGVALVVSAVLRVRAADGSGMGTRALRVALRGAAVLAAAVVLYVLATVSGLLPGDALGNALGRISQLANPEYADNNFERLDIWRATLAMVSDNAITGVGLGCFATGVLPYQTAARLVPHAHNQFLQVLGQSGLIGLLGLALLIRHAGHAVRKGAAHLATDDARRGPFHAAVAALTAALVYCLLETPLHWIEAGSLITILLAVMSRAGCESRVAVPSRSAAHGTLIVAAVLLGIATPGWYAFHAFSAARVQAAKRADDARAAVSQRDFDRAQQSWAAADALLQEADERFPASLEAIMQGTEYAWTRGDLRTAADWQLRGNARFPGAPFQLYSLGSLLMQLNRAEHSIPPLREVALRPGGQSAHAASATLARAYSRNQHYEEAWFLQRELVKDHQLIDEEPGLLLDGVSSLLMLGRQAEDAHHLLERYLDEVEDGEQDERYLHLRARLELQREHWNRALWRGPMWTGWLGREAPE
jgi:O-antigen ligase